MNFSGYNSRMSLRVRALIIPVVASLLSGALLVLATPVFDFWVLGPVALIPFFIAYLGTVRAWPRAGLALLTFFPYCLASGEALFRLSGSWWVGSEGVIGPGLLYASLIWGIVLMATMMYPIALELGMRVRLPVPRPIVLGVVVACMEYLRAMLFAGYSWGALGYQLVDTTYVSHIALIGTVYALTMMYVTWSVALAHLWIRMRDATGSWFQRFTHATGDAVFLKETILLASIFGAVLLFGLWRVHGPQGTQVGLRVAAIASTISTQESIGAGAYRTYRALMLEAVSGGAKLVLTPENVFPYFILDESTQSLTARPIVYLPDAAVLYQDFLKLSSDYADVTFAVGMHTHQGTELYNSIVLYRGGGILGVYHKRYPVPFTEYAPFGFTLPLFQHFSKGESHAHLQIGDVQIGGYICSEIGITPLGTHGADLILSPSNDSALVSRSIMGLHHRFARMKAIEENAPMVRASKGGVTAIIDSRGRTLSAMTDTSGVIFADLP